MNTETDRSPPVDVFGHRGIFLSIGTWDAELHESPIPQSKRDHSLSIIGLERRIMTLLYKVGTYNDIKSLPSNIPDSVVSCIAFNVSILDKEYGMQRNIDQDDGGYCLFAETAYDVHLMYAAVDFDTHPCEWIDLLPDGKYCSSLFLLSNDFAIVCIIPVSLLPPPLKEEL